MASYIGLDMSTFLLSLLVFILAFWTLRKSSNLPPGPFGFPIVGCLPYIGFCFYRTGMTEPYRLFAYLSKQYGSVYSIFLATKLVVVLNNYDSIRDAFRNPHLNDRPRLTLSPDVDAGILMSSGDVWVQQRRFTLSTFRDFGIGKERFQDQISTETQHLRQEFAKCINIPIDPTKVLATAISNVISSVVFGKRFEYTDARFLELLHHLDDQFEASSSGGLIQFLPFIAHFLPGLKKKTLDNAKRFRAFIKGIIDDHRNVFDSQDLNDYIDVFLNELNILSEKTLEGKTAKLSADNLQHSVTQLFIAGSETTVTTLRWSFLYMIAYPEIQFRVQQEIDSVVGRSRLPRLSDKLPFTEATIMEVQRIASIVPLGVPHIAGEDTTLRGFSIPKGTMILSNIWAVHHDPEIWSNPEKFNPERFLDESGDLCQRQEYIPFSVGRRACLGENLAKMELFVFFTHLLHQFSFKKPNDRAPVSFKSTLGATNAPLPFEILVVERN